MNKKQKTLCEKLFNKKWKLMLENIKLKKYGNCSVLAKNVKGKNKSRRILINKKGEIIRL